MRPKKKSYYKPKDKHESPDARQRLGVNGEDCACRYLAKNGCLIIDRNVRCRLGELDIVAIEKNRLCFIEVKTRKSLKYGRPSLALTKEKQRTIRSLARLYIRTHPEYGGLVPRIDVIEILNTGNETFINHIRSAF